MLIGNLLRIKDLKPTSLERIIDGDTEALRRPGDMSMSDALLFVDFLRGMLVLDPEERKPAAEMLDHKWLET